MNKLTLSLVAFAMLLGGQARAVTTGFNQTDAGSYDYNTTSNWVSNTINGTWDSSLTLTTGQTVTFAADTSLGTGLTFNYAGNYALTLDSSSATAHKMTLGGNVSLDTSGGTTANVTIGNGANALNVDLGGVARTMTIAGSRTLILVNLVSNGSLIKDGAGTLYLAGGASNTYTGGTTVSNGTLSLQASGNHYSPVGAGPLSIERTHELQQWLLNRGIIGESVRID